MQRCQFSGGIKIDAVLFAVFLFSCSGAALVSESGFTGVRCESEWTWRRSVLRAASGLQGGILAVDFAAGKENLVFTAGNDHTGQVYDREANRVVASLTGHSKKVTGNLPSPPLDTPQCAIQTDLEIKSEIFGTDSPKQNPPRTHIHRKHTESPG